MINVPVGVRFVLRNGKTELRSNYKSVSYGYYKPTIGGSLTDGSKPVEVKRIIVSDSDCMWVTTSSDQNCPLLKKKFYGMNYEFGGELVVRFYTGYSYRFVSHQDAERAYNWIINKGEE